MIRNPNSHIAHAVRVPVALAVDRAMQKLHDESPIEFHMERRIDKARCNRCRPQGRSL